MCIDHATQPVTALQSARSSSLDRLRFREVHTELGLSLCVDLGVIFVNATKIENRQSDLQCNECISMVMPAPNHPKNIAEKETPESDYAFSFGLRCDQPCRKNRDDHRGPLQLM